MPTDEGYWAPGDPDPWDWGSGPRTDNDPGNPRGEVVQSRKRPGNKNTRTLPWRGEGGTRFDPPPPLPPRVPNPGPTERTNTDKVARELTVNAANGNIPAAYGRTRLGAHIIMVKVSGSDLHIAAAFCVGEIQEIESVTIEDKPSSSLGASVRKYVGSAGQARDTVLFNVEPNFDSALPGLAYAGIRIPASDNISGFPKIEAVVKGRKYRDPRVDPTLSEAGRIYGANPALIIADIWTDDHFGASMPDSLVNWAGSVTTSSDYCDVDIAPANPIGAPTVAKLEGGGALPNGTYTYKISFVDGAFHQTAPGVASAGIVADGGNDAIRLTDIPVGGPGTTWRYIYRSKDGGAYYLVKQLFDNTTTTLDDTGFTPGVLTPNESKTPTRRFEFHGVLERTATLEDVVDTLRAHCQAWTPFNGETFDVICDQPWSGAEVHHFTADDIEDGSMKVQRAGMADVPTRVTVNFTNVFDDLFKDDTVYREISAVTAGYEEKREAIYHLKGCPTADQAARHATYFLNKRLEDTIITFRANVAGLKVVPGDVIKVTHPVGFTATEFRVEQAEEDDEQSSWLISAREYTTTPYLDYVVQGDSPVIGGGATTLEVPENPTNLAVEEVIIETEMGREYVLRGSYTPADSEIFGYTEITVDDGSGSGTLVVDQNYDRLVGTFKITNPRVGAITTITAKTVSKWGIKSSGVSVTITPVFEYNYQPGLNSVFPIADLGEGRFWWPAPRNVRKVSTYGAASWTNVGYPWFTAANVNNGSALDVAYSADWSFPGDMPTLTLDAGSPKRFVGLQVFGEEDILPAVVNSVYWSDDNVDWTNAVSFNLSTVNDNGYLQYEWADAGFHRYWRIDGPTFPAEFLVFEVQFLELVEGALYDSSYWTNDGFASFDGAEVNDGDRATLAFVYSGGGGGPASTLTLDLGVGQSRRHRALRIHGADNIALANIDFSDDGVTWTDVTNIYSVITGTPTTYFWEDSGAHRFWRLTGPDVGGSVDVYEVQWIEHTEWPFIDHYEVWDLVDDAGGYEPRLVASIPASSRPDIYPLPHLFDGNVARHTNPGGGGYINFHVRYRTFLNRQSAVVGATLNASVGPLVIQPDVVLQGTSTTAQDGSAHVSGAVKMGTLVTAQGNLTLANGDNENVVPA